METQTISKALTSVWKFDWFWWIKTMKIFPFFQPEFIEFCRYIFTIVSYLIGVFIFATIVGQVGNVITNRNANRLEFERLLDGAKTYMRHHKVKTAHSIGMPIIICLNVYLSSLFHLTMFRVYFECFYRSRAVWNGVCCAGTITAGLVDGFKAVVISIQLSVCCQTSWKLNWHFMLI